MDYKTGDRVKIINTAGIDWTLKGTEHTVTIGCWSNPKCIMLGHMHVGLHNIKRAVENE